MDGEMPDAIDRPADPDGHTVTVGSCEGAEPVRVGPPQRVEDRSGEIRPQVARPAERLEELLAVDPLLGDLAKLVKPDGYRAGARPRD
jgi:hypothetical protein